jgi:hypothetical protein
MGVAASEGSAVQFPSLERLEKINSIYLHKDKTRLGYGLFLTGDKIVGRKGSRWCWLITTLHTAVIPSGSIYGVLSPSFGGSFWSLILTLVLVELAWVGIDWLLVVPAMDRVFRGKDFSIDELEEKKDFEARRSEVWEVDVRRPKKISPGSVELRLRSGGSFKVQPVWTKSNDRMFEETLRLVQTFTGRQPVYNYKGRVIWRLS